MHTTAPEAVRQECGDYSEAATTGASILKAAAEAFIVQDAAFRCYRTQPSRLWSVIQDCQSTQLVLSGDLDPSSMLR